MSEEAFLSQVKRLIVGAPIPSHLAHHERFSRVTGLAVLSSDPLSSVDGYWHLANANCVPSSGGQLAYKATPKLTLKETVLWGPHQSNTSLEFWRFLSDTIIERRTDRLVVALNSHFATERVDAPVRPRAWWVAAQLPIRWTIRPSWSAAIRPEVAWDSAGRWTLAEQTVKAITSTIEYRIPFRRANALVRLEHRFDESRGPGGGFFDDGEANPSLKPRQHLLVFGLILALDSSHH